MLKAKSSSRASGRKLQVLKEVEKENEVTGFFSLIPLSKKIKLEKYLAEKRMSQVAWLLQKIEELK